MIFSSQRFLQKTNKQIQFYYYETCFRSFFGGNWRQKRHFEIKWPIVFYFFIFKKIGKTYTKPSALKREKTVNFNFKVYFLSQNRLNHQWCHKKNRNPPSEIFSPYMATHHSFSLENWSCLRLCTHLVFRHEVMILE